MLNAAIEKQQEINQISLKTKQNKLYTITII